MIKHQYKKLLLIVLFFSSSLSYAEISDESMNKVLDLSGVTMQVNQFPGLIKVGMEQEKQQGAPIPDVEYNLMITSVDKSILPSTIIEEIKNSLKLSISEEEAKKLLAWYESDLGKEITKAEESASTPDAYQQMMQSAPALLENSERVEFAKRFDALLGVTDMNMDLQEYSGIAIYTAIMTMMQPEVPVNIEPFKAQMDAASAQRRTAIEQMVRVSYVYSYQNIETGKLNKYEAFLTEPTSRKFYKTVVEGMYKGVELSVLKLADKWALIFKGKNQES